MNNENAEKKILLCTLGTMTPICVALGLTHFVPLVNPFQQPHFDLSGTIGVLAYWLAGSGSAVGLPFIAVAMIVISLHSANFTRQQRRTAGITMIVCLLAFLAGGSYCNEFFVKPYFAVPRPNIQELSATSNLGMTVAEFYALPNKTTRSQHLEKVLTLDSKLHPSVRHHWIVETGYSFPSGHAFASMLFATFFFAFSLRYFTKNRWLAVVLVVWVISVCLSRPILRVHSPLDICVGSLEGLTLGLIAFIITDKYIQLAK